METSKYVIHYEMDGAQQVKNVEAESMVEVSDVVRWLKGQGATNVVSALATEWGGIKMTDFDIAKKDAENATGLKFHFYKTAGTKRGELCVDEDGGLRKIVYATRGEAEIALEAIAWVAREMGKKDKKMGK